MPKYSASFTHGPIGPGPDLSKRVICCWCGGTKVQTEDGRLWWIVPSYQANDIVDYEPWVRPRDPTNDTCC